MVKARHSRLLSRKSSYSTLVLTLLLMLSFPVLILLALGILSIPSNSSDSRRKGNGLNSIVRNTIDSDAANDGRGEQWSEVISWIPTV